MNLGGPQSQQIDFQMFCHPLVQYVFHFRDEDNHKLLKILKKLNNFMTNIQTIVNILQFID